MALSIPMIFFSLQNEHTITGSVCLDMFAKIRTNWGQNKRCSFSQDSVPPHYSLEVQCALDKRFLNRWVGREGLIQWPPRSLDLTPMEFVLWEFIKNKVYSVKIQNLNQLQKQIVVAITTVPLNMLQCTWAEKDFFFFLRVQNN